MKVTDAWNALFGTDTDARIVIKTDGGEVEVANIEHFCGLLVITPTDELIDSTQACDDLYEAQQKIEELQAEVRELSAALDEAQQKIEELQAEVRELSAALDEAE